MRDMKGKNKGLYRYISRKRKPTENVGLLLNGEGVLVTKYTEKAKVLSAFFALVFTIKTGLWEYRAPKTVGKV